MITRDSRPGVKLFFSDSPGGRYFRLWGPWGQCHSYSTPPLSCESSHAAAKLLQSCLTLRDPIDGSPPGSAVPGILQARTLEWVAISFLNAWKRKVKVKSLSHVRLLATPWTAAYQAPPSMDFPGKSTGVGCHCLLRKAAIDDGKPTEAAVFW